MIIAALLLVPAFYLLKPAANSSTDTPVQKTNKSQIVTLKIEDSKLVEGSSKVRVKQGESVTIQVTADTEDELHLHGYDKKLELKPGQTAEVTIKANISGSFEAELHTSEAPVFVLEVYPE